MKLTGADPGRQSFKKLCSLHKALAPTAAVHTDGNEEKLLELVYEAQSLLDSAEVSRGEPFKWREDIDLAITCLESYNW